MYISSRELLVLVVGTLEFSGSTPIETQGAIFSDMFMPGKRRSVSEVNLLKFAEKFYGHIKGKYPVFEVVFPTEQNRSEWEKLFQKKEDGSFICKESRMGNLVEEFINSHYYFPMMEAEDALREIGLIK